MRRAARRAAHRQRSSQATWLELHNVLYDECILLDLRPHSGQRLLGPDAQALAAAIHGADVQGEHFDSHPIAFAPNRARLRVVCFRGVSSRQWTNLGQLSPFAPPNGPSSPTPPAAESSSRFRRRRRPLAQKFPVRGQAWSSVTSFKWTLRPTPAILVRVMAHVARQWHANCRQYLSVPQQLVALQLVRELRVEPMGTLASTRKAPRHGRRASAVPPKVHRRGKAGRQSLTCYPGEHFDSHSSAWNHPSLAL